MNSAAKGRRNEHRSRVLLEAAGYGVTRAAVSLGNWDLVGDVVLCKVKTRGWPGSAEIEANARMRIDVAPERGIHHELKSESIRSCEHSHVAQIPLVPDIGGESRLRRPCGILRA